MLLSFQVDSQFLFYRDAGVAGDELSRGAQCSVGDLKLPSSTH
jgi:hypothetical protein